MDIPAPRRSLDQKQCRYEPHILLVPENGPLQLKSSDAVLHTVHMDGAATYNLPFPFVNRPVTRTMPTAGLVNVRCNGGHAWMNAEILVVPHPYYAVTDESGRFELTDVPPGQYQIVAWHEGWKLEREEAAFDVLTERKVRRPIFSDPKTLGKIGCGKTRRNCHHQFCPRRKIEKLRRSHLLPPAGRPLHSMTIAGRGPSRKPRLNPGKLVPNRVSQHAGEFGPLVLMELHHVALLA